MFIIAPANSPAAEQRQAHTIAVRIGRELARAVSRDWRDFTDAELTLIGEGWQQALRRQIEAAR